MDFSIRDESTFYNFSSLPTKMCIFIFGFTHTHIRHVYNETSYRFLVVVNGGYLSTFWCWVIQRSRGGVKVPEFSDSFRLYFCYILLIFDMLVKILLFPAYSFGYEMCWRMSIFIDEFFGEFGRSAKRIYAWPGYDLPSKLVGWLVFGVKSDCLTRDLGL